MVDSNLKEARRSCHQKKKKKKYYGRNVDLVPRSRHLLIEQDLMVDCDGTENFTTASHCGCRKKGGGRLGGGKFLASSMCVPTYCRAMHTAMHTDVVVEGGVLIVGRCLYSLKEHSINTAPNSHLRSCGYHRSPPIASSTIAPSGDLICRRFPFETRTLDDKRSPITYRGISMTVH